MALVDAKGRIRKLWGGYSPKLYDGHFLEVNREWVESSLDGAGVVGDTHFSWGKDNLTNVRFFVPFKKPKKQGDDGQDLQRLTKKQEVHNGKIRRIRARVEKTFTIFHTKFESLNQLWHEDKDQLDALVWTIAGIHNASLV